MKKLFAFLILFFLFVRTFSQVNLQTGSATFSLPMFSWQDSKSRLNSSIAISYNSGNGLKLNEVASNIGQGWSLLAGGMITRIQAGEPDDQPAYAGNGTSEELRKYPPGHLYDPVSPSLGVTTMLRNYPIFKDKNHQYKQHNALGADKELDHFAYNFNGRSGVFVVNTDDKGVSLEDNKLIITFQRDAGLSALGIRTTITSFQINDEGIIYKFSQHQLVKVLKTGYCDKGLNPIKQPKFKNDKVYFETSYEDAQIINPYIINGWYLTEIEDALTHRKINLTYAVRNISSNDIVSLANYTSNSTGIFTPEKNYSIISRLKSVTKTPAITSISYPDGHQANFNYGNERVDLKNDLILESVDVTYNSRYLSRYLLNSTYFILNRFGIPVSDYQKKCARLCLKSVKKLGVDLRGEDPPYRFDYHLGSSNAGDFVPPPFFYLRDIWGYYNGNNSINFFVNNNTPAKAVADLSNYDVARLCFIENNLFNAKPGYAKNGLLKQITYPTGGSINYVYEQSLLWSNGQNIPVGGVSVSQTTVTDGGYQNDCNNPIATNYHYSLNSSNTQSSLWGFEMPKNEITTNNYYVPEYKYFFFKFPFSFGCDYRYKYPGIVSQDQAVNVSALMQGVQIAMNIWSTVSTAQTIIKAITSGNPATLIIQIIVDIAISCIGDHHVDNTTTVRYNTDLTSSNPLPVQYKRVEVIEGGGSNGKTVYEFTSPEYYPIWEPNNSLYSAKQRFAYWAYGLLKKTTVYDYAGYPVKQTENVYGLTKAQKRLGYLTHGMYSQAFTSCKYLVTNSFSMRSTTWENADSYKSPDTYTAQSNNDMLVEIYYTYSGRVELSSVYERTYKPGSTTQFLELSTHYSYDYYNYQLINVTSTQTNGDKNFKEIVYSNNIDNTGLLSTNNILNIPVKVTTGVIKNGTYQDTYLSETLTEFVLLANGDVKPSRILEKRFTQPTTNLNVAYKEIQTFTYDATGNLIGMKDEGNHTVTNIYDYLDKYVVASVVNAEPQLDHPAYTSFETDNYFGGWNVTGPQIYSTANSVTGTRSFILDGSNSFSSTINPSKSYLISLWATGNISVSNGTLLKSAPSISGYTYLEYRVNAGPSNITVSGSGSIDELRLYPENARMRTISYDPLIGKTSESDENNRITYYEYDANSRLQFIKDEKKNVVKMYEYKIAHRATGCPPTYTNLAVSEIYVKQCPSGYRGSSVVYTIAEGQYTSTISQLAVDIQVQNDLNANGQAYANANGVCTPIFYNSALAQTFTKEGCETGYKGTSITYTIPYGRYSSTVSQAEANEQAQDDMDGNGQAYANLPGNASCIMDTDPDWIGTGTEDCQNGNKMMQVMDQNPYSSSYGQMQWVDTGFDATCPPASSCDYYTCNNVEGRSCINGACEWGYKIYTGSYTSDGYTYCYYHYEFSDGSWSQNYLEQSYGYRNCYESY